MHYASPGSSLKVMSGLRPTPTGSSALQEEDLLRWLYLGRMTLISGVMVGALLGLYEMDLAWTAILFGASLGWTLVSYWQTHLVERGASNNFRYLQALFDVVLVALLIRLTGSSFTDFSPLYILVISEGALLLPLPGGVLIGAMASVLFFGEVAWFQQEALSAQLALQIGLFTMVAIVTGILGDRLRRAGLRLGAIETELEQLRLDTSDILDNLSTGVLTVDGAGRLAYLNPAGAELLRIDPGQWFGEEIIGTVEGIAPGMGALLTRSTQQRLPQSRFKTTMSRDGRSVTLGVSTTMLERTGEGPPSVTAIFQDITDQERAESLDRRNQRLEAVAELSASLAHEIKNPLASIRSAIEQLSGEEVPGRAAPAMEVEDRQILQRLVLTESDRLSRLLSDFLEFSVLRMGQPETHDFAEIVSGAVRLARQHPEAADGVSVSCTGQDAPIHIPGDRDLLHRMVYNLVLNALQFAGEDGKVEVELSDLRTLKAPARSGGVDHPVRLRVRDSGPGVDEKEADRIFDPFFTRRDGGSGLGLAVVQRAVRAHDGSVFVGSAPGGGAEFTLYLPGGKATWVGDQEGVA